MMELLSPAGNFDALRAAVQNGADAVYLGADRFSARANAGNFDTAGLEMALEYAHVRGVRLYLTLNTLLTDEELPAAMEVAAFACRIGFDAIIVQDIGLSALLRRELSIPIHASTQMTIHNKAGMEFAHSAGIRRVVLARELSLAEIADLHRDDMEIEVFAHGALCVCWSGQCLMSSMIGGRSGNRGSCAQPCRLPWRVQNQDAGYALSMRDLMALELLPQLEAVQVTALKLEGRMKSPEYVAIATGIYRKYIDLLAQNGAAGYRVDEADLKTLRQLFARGGFTSRYLTVPGKRFGAQLVDAQHQKHLGLPLGKVEAVDGLHVRLTLLESITRGDGAEVHDRKGEMPSTVITDIKSGANTVRKSIHQAEAKQGDTVWIGDFRLLPHLGAMVYRTTQKTLFDRARDSFEKDDHRLVPIQLSFDIAVDAPARLIVRDGDGHDVQISSTSACEQAHKAPLDEKRIKEQLGKTGGTPYTVQDFCISTDGQATLPASELNRMRREALNELTEKRIQGYMRLELAAGTLPQVLPAAIQQVNKTAIKQGKRTTKPVIGIEFVDDPDISCIEPLMSAERWLLPSALLLSEDGLYKLKKLRSMYEGELLLTIPAVLREADMELLPIFTRFEELFDGFSVGQVGLLSLLARAFPQKVLLSDIGCNVWNQETLQVLAQAGASGAVLSPEALNRKLASPVIPLTVIGYGRIPVMTLEHCPGSTVALCNGKCQECSAASGMMTDRAGAIFPYRRSQTGHTLIYHNLPIRVENLASYAPESISELRILVLQEPISDVFMEMNRLRQLSASYGNARSYPI